MFKYTILVAAIVMSCGAAMASLAQATKVGPNPRNVTVIYKNSVETSLEYQSILYCGLEDCFE